MGIKLVQEHKSIEKIKEHLDGKKNTIPENWNYKKARELFHNPEVTPAKDIELKWENPDEEKLVEFMCQKNGFNEERIRSGAQKLLITIMMILRRMAIKEKPMTHLKYQIKMQKQ